jgi:hypothetical protein
MWPLAVSWAWPGFPRRHLVDRDVMGTRHPKGDQARGGTRCESNSVQRWLCDRERGREHAPATTNHRRQTQSPRRLSPGLSPRGTSKAPPAEAPRKTRGGNGRSDCRQQPECGTTGGCLQERIQNCDYRSDGGNIVIATRPSTTSGHKVTNQEKSGRIGAGPSARPRARWTNRDFSGRIGGAAGAHLLNGGSQRPSAGARHERQRPSAGVLPWPLATRKVVLFTGAALPAPHP